jgi:DHA1 family 2-module integral membrane pump EmrD-like MFS transporter
MFKHWVLTLTILLLMVMQFSSDLSLPSFPAMQADLGVSAGDIQLTTLYSIICFGLSLFVWGPCSDCFGRRPVALMGLLIFIMGCGVCVFSETWLPLMLGRCLQGIGIGSAGALSPALPKDIFSGKKLVWAFALLSMSMGAFPIMAQISGGYLQAAFGWRSNFIFLTGLGVFTFLLFWRTFPETNTYATEARQQFSVVSLLKQSIAVLQDLPFAGYVLCLTLVYAGEIAYSIVAPFIIQNQLGLNPVQHGWLSFFTGGGLLVGAGVSAKLSEKVNIHHLISIGIFLMLISAISMIFFVHVEYYSVQTVIGPMTLYMIGAGMLYPNCIAGIMDRFPQQSGVVGALMSSLQMVGAGVFNTTVTFYHIDQQKPLSFLLFALVCLTFLSFYTAVLRPRTQFSNISLAQSP